MLNFYIPKDEYTRISEQHLYLNLLVEGNFYALYKREFEHVHSKSLVRFLDIKVLGTALELKIYEFKVLDSGVTLCLSVEDYINGLWYCRKIT